MERTVVELIAHKRDGHALASSEIARVIRGFMTGEVADYQVAALLMAVFFRGMTDEETVALTDAMLRSGSIVDLADVPGIKVDKHSTGGVGDKVSIALAPLVAACGVRVPMVSGRGLGHTGGTLDKLEAIPGFSTDLTTADFKRIVREVGAAMIGQTSDVAPADKRIYALRDVTATVECVPLIVASILSKKLAEGIDALVLDVKVGRGAFMKDRASAEVLAKALVRVGRGAGKDVIARLTAMDTPLGVEIGNANETREAIAVLTTEAPADLTECTFELAADMLILGKVAADRESALAKIEDAIASGAAAETLERMIAAQGGDASVVGHPEKLALAPDIVAVRAARSGFVTAIDALEIGLSAVAMGAGRTRADQKVDPGVGIRLLAKPGDAVRAGDPIAELFVRNDAGAGAVVDRVGRAFTVGDAPPAKTPLFLGRIDA